MFMAVFLTVLTLLLIHSALPFGIFTGIALYLIFTIIYILVISSLIPEPKHVEN